MAPFTFGTCPTCSAQTRQRILALETDADVRTICETCFTVISHYEDGSLTSRVATDEERAAVPPRVVWSDEERAEWEGLLREGRAELRAWVRAGFPGLTPDLERALPPGTVDRLKEIAELPDDGRGPI